MAFDHGLQHGEVINNTRLRDVFKCGTQGGMRRSHRTNTLILVSDHTKAIYEDRWIDDILHYTGMGLREDQDLNSNQNKTLNESPRNGICVFLFEVFEQGQYIFIGQVELSDEPYKVQQIDVDGNIRWVWVFPLKLTEGEPEVSVPEKMVAHKRIKQAKAAHQLDDDQLRDKVQYVKGKASSRNSSTILYDRNQYVAEYAKRRANGICQLCDQPAPFNNKNGTPYLESHHIDWISSGGEDSIDNTVALCPNCHRKMHSLNLKTDNKKLKARAQEVL